MGRMTRLAVGLLVLVLSLSPVDVRGAQWLTPTAGVTTTWTSAEVDLRAGWQVRVRVFGNRVTTSTTLIETKLMSDEPTWGTAATLTNVATDTPEWIHYGAARARVRITAIAGGDIIYVTIHVLDARGQVIR